MHPFHKLTISQSVSHLCKALGLQAAHFIELLPIIRSLTHKPALHQINALSPTCTLQQEKLPPQYSPSPQLRVTYSNNSVFTPKRCFWNSNVGSQPYSDIVILHKQEQSCSVEKLQLKKDKQFTVSMDQQNVLRSCTYHPTPFLCRERRGIQARSNLRKKTSVCNVIWSTSWYVNK